MPPPRSRRDRSYAELGIVGHDTEDNPIRRAQSGSRGRTSEYFQLLSEEDVLESDLRC